MRYVHLLLLQFRMSVALGMQYRANFLIDGGLSLLWAAIGVVPLYVAFHGRGDVQGWTYEGALVVMGWFTVLKGVLDGAVNPSLTAVVEHIRQGTLDFVLLKPADAQFLVSTAKYEPWKLLDLGVGVGILSWAFVRLQRVPALLDVALALVLLASAMVVLYSLWILVISAAFWVVRLDNLAYLFNSIFDFARWPAGVFRGFYRILFTFVIPLTIMTTYPAEALLGTLAGRTAALSLCGSAAFAIVARIVWKRAIGHYTSASS